MTTMIPKQFFLVTLCLGLLLISSCSTAFLQSTTSRYNHSNKLIFRSKSHLLHSNINNNNNDDNDNHHNKESNIDNNNNTKKNKNLLSRRLALTQSTTTLLSTVTILNTNTIHNANAIDIDINPFTPLDRKPMNDFQYTPAKRATSYLVDSTIPPTLVPFKAQREAAILKGLGNGSGTAKTPYIEESLNLNNMMNKGVFGTIDFIQGIVTSEDSEESSSSDDGKVNEGGGGGRDGKKKQQQGYDATFVFLGLDYNNVSGDDVQLAISLISDMTKPRRGLDTSIALSFVPISLQKALNDYVSIPSSSDDMITNALINDGKISESIVMNQLPILQYAKAKQLKLIATSPEPIDVQTVRTQGLQNVDPERRSQYVLDSQGFIDWTQDSKNKLYTEKSLLKDWKPLDEKETTPGGFFAEKILVHETIATRMANYALLDDKKGSLVINVGSIADLRFLGGPNGRIARICKAIKPDAIVDDSAVTTILINPTAEETLSQSKFLRLEIGTAPQNLAYQTKVADYLWFSQMPKVNMLPRLMNG